EDGIRAFHVTGVQTCALPIYGLRIAQHLSRRAAMAAGDAAQPDRIEFRIAARQVLGEGLETREAEIAARQRLGARPGFAQSGIEDRKSVVEGEREGG